MMQEMTSLTLKYAFSAPEMPPTRAAAMTATIRHTIQGIFSARAQ